MGPPSASTCLVPMHGKPPCPAKVMGPPSASTCLVPMPYPPSPELVSSQAPHNDVDKCNVGWAGRETCKVCSDTTWRVKQGAMPEPCPTEHAVGMMRQRNAAVELSILHLRANGCMTVKHRQLESNDVQQTCAAQSAIKCKHCGICTLMKFSIVSCTARCMRVWW